MFMVVGGRSEEPFLSPNTIWFFDTSVSSDGVLGVAESAPFDIKLRVIWRYGDMAIWRFRYQHDLYLENICIKSTLSDIARY